MQRDDTGRRDDTNRGARQQAEQVAFRGEMATVCANEATNTPELCGSEEPVVDADGKPLRPETRDVPHSAPKK